MAIPRGLKPKQHRRQQWEMGRVLVRISRRIRTVRFQSQVLRHFIERMRAAVEELRPVEREMARVQSRIETAPARAEGIKELRKEQRGYAQQTAAARGAIRLRGARSCGVR